MEELFREILIPVPSAPETIMTPDQVVKEELDIVTVKKAEGNLAEMDFDVDESSSVDWASELDMQRLLDSLQQHTSTALATSGLDLFSWNDVQGVDLLSATTPDVV